MKISKITYKAFDIETTGFHPRDGARIFAFCIGDLNGIDVYRMDHNSKSKNQKSWDILKEFFTDTSIAKVCHNYKFEYEHITSKFVPFKIPKKTIWHDTMLMSQLLRNNAMSHALDHLCYEYGGYTRELDKQVHAEAKKVGTYDKIDKDLMHRYQIADGERTVLLFELFFNDITNDPQLYDDYLNELALVKTTLRLEDYGLRIDKGQSRKLIEWMKKELNQVQKDTYKLIGYYANLNSDKQLSKILFNIYKFPITKLTKKAHQPSVDKDVLLYLSETYPDKKELFDLIFKYRSYTTGKAAIRKYINLTDKNDIIHPTINTNKAKTGRESGENPNLQNVSKKEALKNPFPIPARQCFRNRKGRLLYFVDYKGIEMRLIVDAANEQEMIKILEKNGDLHHVASCYFFYYKGKNFIQDLKESNTKQYEIFRSAGKNLHFALPYGGGIAKLASIINISVENLLPGLKLYKNRFPSVGNFSRNLTNQVKQMGYVKTAFGRKLYIENNKAYSGANYLIQGTAAGILKRAQVRVDKYLKEEWNDDIRIVLPIHDEIVLSYPRFLLEHETKILNDIRDIMIDMKEIKVPLDVEWKVTTTNWDKAKELKL